jgi:hypothetical protein
MESAATMDIRKKRGRPQLLGKHKTLSTLSTALAAA